MLFDQNDYAAAMQELAAAGDSAATTAYLEKEFRRMQEAKLTGAACGCCGQSACRASEDEMAWKHNRLQGLIVTGSELANCYCASRAWEKCFALYDTLEAMLSSAGAGGTEAYARVLLNRAYAHMEHGDTGRALALAQDVEGRLAEVDSRDQMVWAMLYELLAVAHRAVGHETEAAAAAQKAAERRKAVQQP